VTPPRSCLAVDRRRSQAQADFWNPSRSAGPVAAREIRPLPATDGTEKVDCRDGPGVVGGGADDVGELTGEPEPVLVVGGKRRRHLGVTMIALLGIALIGGGALVGSLGAAAGACALVRSPPRSDTPLITCVL
jgi:hypothetical protein